MFTAQDLPRANFTTAGRGWHGSFDQALSTGQEAYIALYNPQSAVASAFTQLLVRRMSAVCDDEAGSLDLYFSSDVADLDGLSNVLGAGNHYPILADGTLDAVSVVAIGTSFAPALSGIVYSDRLGADDHASPLHLDYPLILPPGVALVAHFHGVISSTRNNVLNVAWWRA